MTDRNAFAYAFIEAALWADAPEDYQGPGLARETEEAMIAEAGAFWDKYHEDIRLYPEGIAQAGHDLWFTTCGHGVGFWENDDPVSQKLDRVCREAIPYNEGLEEGDDGRLHWIGVK